MSREEGEGGERRDDVGKGLVSFSDGRFMPAWKNGSAWSTPSLVPRHVAWVRG